MLEDDPKDVKPLNSEASLKSDEGLAFEPHTGKTTTPEALSASTGEPLATPDRRLGGMTQSGGDLAQPLRNRRSTDSKTPPTQVIANTNMVEESKGLGALLRSLWSKIMPKKSA